MTDEADGVLFAPCLFDGEYRYTDALVHIEGGYVAAVEPARSRLPAHTKRLPSDALLVPGFVDIQVNGGGGALLNTDVSAATIRTIAEAHRGHGTTAMLPTMITDLPTAMQALAACAVAAMKIPGIVGFHLEGPFINANRRGAHRADYIRAPTASDLDVIGRLAASCPTLVTLAPEHVDDATIADLVARGVIVSLGHSDATTAHADRAMTAGARGITHLFNAMSQIGAREPGLVGATFANDRVFAGIIADGHHVADANLRLAARLLGRDRLMLISDAMATAGSDVTAFELQGRRITLLDGRLTDAAGTLAGAHLTMIDAVRYMVRVGIELDSALTMATRTPARFLGIEARHGTLAPGARADMVALRGHALAVHAVWMGGTLCEETAPGA